jgi:hypothetical protein
MVYYGVYPTVYLIVYHIWFTPVISENLPLKSRLEVEGEGVLIIRHRSTKKSNTN